jgi:hypothetical protein
MYRDAPAALDERDRAVGAILIGEALIASCARAQVVGKADGSATWRAIRDAHDDFPEIWRSLDRARLVLARRGINVTGYDELRPHVRTQLATSGDGADVVRVDPAALEDARRAAEELKLAVPGADWAAIEQRTRGLVRAPFLHHKRSRAIVGALVVTLAVVVLAWASALTPHKKLGRCDVDSMHRELAEITRQRRVKIVELQRSLGERCDPPQAHELAKQLVMDGRSDDVKSFAAAYTDRCGEDLVVMHWAKAPRAGAVGGRSSRASR